MLPGLLPRVSVDTVLLGDDRVEGRIVDPGTSQIIEVVIGSRRTCHHAYLAQDSLPQHVSEANLEFRGSPTERLICLGRNVAHGVLDRILVLARSALRSSASRQRGSCQALFSLHDYRGTGLCRQVKAWGMELCEWGLPPRDDDLTGRTKLLQIGSRPLFQMRVPFTRSSL